MKNLKKDLSNGTYDARSEDYSVENISEEEDALPYPN